MLFMAALTELMAYNRTILELKQMYYQPVDTTVALIIAPFWN